MIRLNDINKTVIDESKVVAYYGYEEEKDYCVCIALNGNRYRYVDYNSKEARDKDIELLDKLFDVKSIEDKANAYPDEIDALKFAMSGIKQECEPVKEEYITYDEVVEKAKKEPNSQLWGRLPNNKTVALKYDPVKDVIYFISPYGDMISGEIYDGDLFNALKLKKGE